MRSLAFNLALALLPLTLLPPAAAAEQISISPGSGRERDTFTIVGSDLPVGMRLDVHLFSPESRLYRLTGDNGLRVGPDGEFSVSVVPEKQLVGAITGGWTVEICSTDSDTCVAGDFEIMP